MSQEHQEHQGKYGGDAQTPDQQSSALEVDGSARSSSLAPSVIPGAVLQRKIMRRAIQRKMPGGHDAAAGRATERTDRDTAAAPAPGASASVGGLPSAVQSKMEDAFDFNFGGVRVHEGGQAKEMGALAYTQGADVHFAPGQYDPGSSHGQQLIGHELAHVVQQSEGRVAATTQLKGADLNEDSVLEREADDWGARAARGESIARTGGGGAGGNGPIQRFKDFTAAGDKDSKKNSHWANATGLRVAEDGTAAIAQARLSGSKEMYVLDSRLAGINGDLAAAHAPLRLRKSAGSVSGAEPGDLEKSAHTLERVTPVEASDGKTDKTIPDDCGNAARTVTGAVADGKTLRAEYVGKDGKATHTVNSDPALMKYEIMINHFGDKMPHVATVLAEVQAASAKTGALGKTLEPFVAELNTLGKSLGDAAAVTRAINDAFVKVKAAHEAKVKAVDSAGAADKTDQIKALEATFAAAKKQLNEKFDDARKRYLDADAKWKAFLGKDVGGKKLGEVLNEYFGAKKVEDDLIAEIMGPYLGMSGAAQETFDEKAGINRHANPDVGEAYTISSGGANKPNGKSVWNFHWGGVVFKSTTGSDNITMENYAGNATSEWRLQMYGVPTKGHDRKGQTFQEQHRDAHGQHGETPTTLSTEKT